MARGVKVDGQTLRRMRGARRLSQARLADKAGVTTATVNRIENGHPASFETVESLASVLGLDADLLLAETPEAVLAGIRSSGNGGGSTAVLDFSDAGGVALMDRIEAGETEEAREIEDRYIEYVAGNWGDQDARTIEDFEQAAGYALAGLVLKDRDEGAEAIQRALRRIRKTPATENGGG